MAKKRGEMSDRGLIAELTFTLSERQLQIRKLNIQNVKLRERIEVLEKENKELMKEVKLD